MNDEKVNQGKNTGQGILFLIARLLGLWIIAAVWIWVGVNLAAMRTAATVWLIAGLIFPGWVLLTCIGIKWIFAQHDKIIHNIKVLLTAIYLVLSLPMLAILLGFFFLGLGTH